MNIVLIGMMGSGKSTIGKIIAQTLAWDFYDVDKWIEKERKKTIAEIFSQEGEATFRALESKIIKELAQKNNSVISPGGGAPCFKENWDALKKNGTIIWLKASPQKLLENVKKKPLSLRPLLTGKTSSLETISMLLNKREIFYQKADWVVETDALSLEQTSEKIVNFVKSIK
ncbi:MAG: hypothetical protein A3I11_06570 [Elusimicrobia bacterium RIFCSPLOWO2_02_FULL_39_32]|nr:MAG: hypothetical protein A3B80_09180 [Elusimicrobia bacterium RIFCSPHIGHO2_02_FULL_39_36]OGR91780.1 MAG: hypothetical protein A3I11_06570 [Elusimicrobia bacterium RIFCSPLOWO2_02_FULL_39_32]OGR98439.1 MAG: hypothetical protein A3G85_02430 [Elusimicrobia bacterium RIFCSPLOWO2_12_FULL_39_28]